MSKSRNGQATERLGKRREAGARQALCSCRHLSSPAFSSVVNTTLASCGIFRVIYTVSMGTPTVMHACVAALPTCNRKAAQNL